MFSLCRKQHGVSQHCTAASSDMHTHGWSGQIMVYVKCSWNRLIAIRQENIGVDISNRLVAITFYGHALAEPLVLLVGSVPLLLQASCCFI